MVYYELSVLTRRKTPKTVECYSFTRMNPKLSALDSIITTVLRNYRWIKSKKSKESVQILKLLDKIIPKEYFGVNSNRSVFYHMVKKILTHSASECVQEDLIMTGYDLGAIPWLRHIQPEDFQKCLLTANKFLLEFIVKPLILYYYKPIKTFNGQGIEFFRREKWYSFHKQVIYNLEKNNYLQLSSSDKILVRGRLIIIPKGDCNIRKYRPLVSLYPKFKKYNRFATLIKKIYNAAQNINEEDFSRSFFQRWAKFVQNVGKEAKLYAVKLDIRDAFGNVQISQLSQIIKNLDNRFLTDSDKEFVIEHIENQFVKFSGKVFRWNHGLLQGDRLSSCLCELYMSQMERNLFLSIKSSDCFVFRNADDYFCCSTDLIKVQYFECVIRRNQKVNFKKSKISICDHEDKNMTYLGKIINLTTKEMKKSYDFKEKYDIRQKFKIWNPKIPLPVKDPKRLLKRSMEFKYNNQNFTKIEINTIFNSEKTVLENFFEGMVYIAYKFDVTIMAIRTPLYDDIDYIFVWNILQDTVMTYSKKALHKLAIYSGIYKKTTITLKHLTALSYRAFILVFKRRNEVYKNLIQKIKEEQKLYFHLNQVIDLNMNYFLKLPPVFNNIKMNRSVSI